MAINRRHSKEKIEKQKLKLDYRPKRLKRSIESASLILDPSNSEQVVYDATNAVASSLASSEREHLQLSASGGRQQRDIERKVGKQQQQQAGNCSEFSELEPELGSEAAKIRQLLSRYYRIGSSLARKSPQITDERTNELDGSSSSSSRVSGSKDTSGKLELPRPSNVSVLIISWYPPILKLSWNLNELSEGDTNRLNFYENNSETTSSEQHGAPSSASSTFFSSHQDKDKDLLSEFDLELAIDNAAAETETARMETKTSSHSERRKNVTEGVDDNLEDVSTLDADIELARELRRRRFLVRKSLTCFQITYNIINSR